VHDVGERRVRREAQRKIAAAETDVVRADNLRRPRLAWAHLPAAVWGALIEFAGWVCPLTPLEVRLRVAAGEAPYSGGFIAHYLLPLVYPDELTRGMQVALGLGVLGVNAAVYGALLRRRRRARRT